MAVAEKVSKVDVNVSLSKVPTKIANRILSFGVSVEGSLFGATKLSSGQFCSQTISTSVTSEGFSTQSMMQQSSALK